MNVTISAIEGTTTLSQIPISVIGFEDGMHATISPQDIDVYLVGPINSLNEIEPEDIHAVIELQDLEDGSYQLAPRVEVSSSDSISVQYVTPATIEVQISHIETPDEDAEEASPETEP